jgi:succinate dehydrogenase/fumarate reductase-like Fe-S protein
VKNELFVELFRFNEQTDYLPYYQKHTLEYSENDTVNDLLDRMNKIEAFGYDENCNLKVNDLYINASEDVAKIVERCGNEIQINPISEFRVKKDMQIDRSDFVEKLSLIDDYIGAEQNIAYRKSTELAYYASNTLNYNRDYIGDHVLIIAADIIEKRFELRNEIIEKLISEENGLWYHTSLENRMLCDEQEKKIQKLIYLAQEHIKPRSKISKRIASLCAKKSVQDFESASSVSLSSVSQSFSGFNIAAYHGVQASQLEELIAKSNASYVDIPSKNDDLASHSVLMDENFSYKIAGDILMQAKDNNADFVLVKNEATKNFLDKNQPKIEKIAGRELGVSIVSQDQFVQLLEGEQDISKLGFNDHKVKISFLG